MMQSCEQFRKIVFKYLAALACFKIKCSSGCYPGRNTAEIDAKQFDDAPNEVLNHVPEGQPCSSSPAAATEASGQVTSGSERLLVNIRDLLETSVGRMTQQHDKDDENQRMMDDWVVAAAIIDRICFILISIFFVLGTAALIVLCVR